jgi:hypothetical protein
MIDMEIAGRSKKKRTWIVAIRSVWPTRREQLQKSFLSEVSRILRANPTPTKRVRDFLRVPHKQCV